MKKIFKLLIFLPLLLVFTACGDEDSTGGSGFNATFPENFTLTSSHRLNFKISDTSGGGSYYCYLDVDGNWINMMPASGYGGFSSYVTCNKVGTNMVCSGANGKSATKALWSGTKTFPVVCGEKDGDEYRSVVAITVP